MKTPFQTLGMKQIAVQVQVQVLILRDGDYKGGKHCLVLKKL